MEREFFVDEPIDTRIVRESIQNSLGAAANQTHPRNNNAANPVQVRFSLSAINTPLPPEPAARYFDGLESTYNVCLDKHRWVHSFTFILGSLL